MCTHFIQLFVSLFFCYFCMKYFWMMNENQMYQTWTWFNLHSVDFSRLKKFIFLINNLLFDVISQYLFAICTFSVDVVFFSQFYLQLALYTYRYKYSYIIYNKCDVVIHHGNCGSLCHCYGFELPIEMNFGCALVR